MLGFATLPDVAVDSTTAELFEDFTRQHLGRGSGVVPLDPPADALTYVRWLARHRPVLFHGSRRGDLDELRPDRESRDSTAFGDQRAVFASDDPVWAMWFALLVRGPTFRSTRNGAWSVRGARRHRQYFFSINAGVPDSEVLTDGWLYVLSRQGFREQRPIAGILTTSQWTGQHPVRPLARISVRPDDFPFRSRIGRHDPAESMLRTLRRSP